jgi:hypothetical protein
VATLAFVEIAGSVLGRVTSDESLHFPIVLLSCALVFGVLFVQRVGLQGGIDFGNFDSRAGVFGQAETAAWIVAAGNVWKQGVAAVMTLTLVLSRAQSSLREALARALVAAFTIRFGVMLLTLVVAGGSFWTAMRVMSDLPFSLLFSLCAAFAYAAVTRAQEAAASRA